MKLISAVYGRVAGAILRFLVRAVYRPKLYFSGEVPRGVFICAANHDSLFDGPILVTALEKLGPTAALMAKEWFDKPLLSPIFRSVGCVPVDRSSHTSAAWMRESIRAIDGGSNLLIFPEGHTSKGNGIDKFKPGALMIAHRAGAPILPVWHSSPKVFRRTVIRVGIPTVLPSEFSVKEAGAEMSRELREAVIALSRE